MPLPPSWKVTFGSGNPGALRLSLASVAASAGSISMALWRQGPSVVGRASFPLGAAQIDLAAFPTLDEVWSLYLLACRESGREWPAAFEAMCQYAEDSRQGLWPDRVKPEQAIQALYLVLAQGSLMSAPPRSERFLEDAIRLCEAICRHLEAAKRLLDDPITETEPWLERAAALLTSDHALYREDLTRARAFTARLPAAASATGGARALPLLALRRPVATQFKLWARRDLLAPGGRGYPLLLAELCDGSVVLSADPACKARVGFVAPKLSEKDQAPWYDGRDHEGTLAASPKQGTRLSFDEVLRALTPELGLSETRASRPRGRQLTAAAALAVCLALAVLGARSLLPEDAVLAGGSKGDPIPKDQVLNLLGSDDGPRSMAHYALVAGVCSYTGARELRSPCRDARAMRELLVRHYGYDEKNILFLVDKPEPGERTDAVPTAANLRLAIEKFRERFGDHELSSFLFYYSGHGGYEKGARKDFGVLQPAGYFDHDELPISDRGWDMQELIDGIHKGVPARHVMIVLDACYSGWAVGSKGEDALGTDLKSLWKERAEVVLSAGTRGQRAWEDDDQQSAWAWDGHSALTAFLLQGLSPSPAGAVAADLSQDGVVTDEELARYLRVRVPESVKAVKRADQVPQFFRFDDHLPRSGQFLLVPAARRN